MAPQSPEERKSRATLDRLTPDEQRLFAEYCEAHTLADGVSYLLKVHDIALTDGSVSEWLKKRRAATRHEAFRDWLAGLKQTETEALTASNELTSALALADSASKTIAVALFEAQREKDILSMRQLGELVIGLVGTVSAAKRAEVAAEAGALAREKFQFDAAKAALAHAAELQDISRAGGSEREKVSRAIERMFGIKPVEAASTP